MQDELEFTQALAREAGAYILAHLPELNRLTDKAEGEAVTNLDKAVNQLILDKIQERYPDDDILSEEDDPVEKGENARLWVVDPIDGTVNMTRGIPFFCVSIALWCEGEPRVGVIYDPNHQETFSAIAGKGATLNNAPIHVTDHELGEGVVLHGQPYNKHDAELGWVKVKSLRAVSLSDRQLGSAALMLCYVACGRAELMAITGTKAWDNAAGVLIVSEAGGVASSLEGEDWKLETPSIMAGNTVAHAQALTLL